MIDAEAIRDAFAALADEAPDARPVRAALAGRARRHRQRRLVLRLAGAGTLAATTGVAVAGVWRLTRPSDPDFPVLDGGPGGGWLEVPLRFRPSWLPHRYGEAGRGFIVDGDRAPVLSRDYQRGSAEGVISLLVGWHTSLDPNRPSGTASTVDINGSPGQLVRVDSNGLATYVSWQPPGQPQLMVSVLTGDGAAVQRDVALRVARSVRPDPGLTWVGPRFGWRPPDLATKPWQLSQRYDGADWMQDVTVNGAGGRQLIISMGPGAAQRFENTFASEPIQIGEWIGRLVAENGQLFLTLPDGVEAFVQLDSASNDQMVQTMEAFDFGPWPDMSWVGGR
ncbi:hypothetical protein K1W54_18075 [Micromonospora sp. CPCC 205371]|nr:hypothetical protein [Micromonospora sp. CPCC 205371]